MSTGPSQVAPKLATHKIDFLQFLFVGIGTWFTVLVLKLKSFIWSVYQAMLLTIAYEGKKLEDEASEKP